MQKIGALVNGVKIRDARLAADMSRADLANAIRSSERNIARWETGQNQPRVSSVALIAAATGHDLEFFLTSSNEDDEEEAASMPLSRDQKVERLSRMLVDLLGEGTS